MTKKCHICDVEMEKRKTTINTGWGEYKLTVEGVQTYMCPICGEITIEGKDAQMLQRLSKSFSESDMSEKPDQLNLSEVAEMLRVSNQTIYNMIRDGRLKAQKIGREWRFSKKEIQSLTAGDQMKVK